MPRVSVQTELCWWQGWLLWAAVGWAKCRVAVNLAMVGIVVDVALQVGLQGGAVGKLGVAMWAGMLRGRIEQGPPAGCTPAHHALPVHPTPASPQTSGGPLEKTRGRGTGACASPPSFPTSSCCVRRRLLSPLSGGAAAARQPRRPRKVVGTRGQVL